MVLAELEVVPADPHLAKIAQAEKHVGWIYPSRQNPVPSLGSVNPGWVAPNVWLSMVNVSKRKSWAGKKGNKFGTTAWSNKIVMPRL